ncbi:unnamed protein product [Linum trigynum]|uniref:Uncharacterized protein n=1 Tax=Linum trigynum TaxID=586398 RepID=A0AAV2GUG3_9ROSI
MKKEAVMRRPMESMRTDRVGYQVIGTGAVTGFDACKQTRHRYLSEREMKCLSSDRSIQRIGSSELELEE